MIIQPAVPVNRHKATFVLHPEADGLAGPHILHLGIPDQDGAVDDNPGDTHLHPAPLLHDHKPGITEMFGVPVAQLRQGEHERHIILARQLQGDGIGCDHHMGEWSKLIYTMAVISCMYDRLAGAMKDEDCAMSKLYTHVTTKRSG